MVLLGARPGHGKTSMGLELIAEAIKQGRRGMFFTLEYTQADVQNNLRSNGSKLAISDNCFEVYDSDNISSGYIMERLVKAPQGSVAIVDYLQLLDQKRENPELTHQVQALKSFAREYGIIIILISQIDRSFDVNPKPFPELEDVRLPNPLDLTLFSKTCFLNNGEVQVGASI